MEQSSQHIVVHLDDELEVAGLLPVDIYAAVELLSSLGDFQVEEEQVFNFSEQGTENGVKVNSDESFLSEVGLLTDEEEFVKLGGGVLLDAFNPLGEFDLVELLEVAHQRGVQLGDVLVLFALFDGGGEGLKTIKGFLDTLMEALGPVESTSNRRHVEGDGCTLVDLLNEDAAFVEDGSNNLEVLLIQLQKSNVLLFKLILDNLTGKKSIKAVKELEFADNGIRVIERLSQDRGKSALELLDALAELEEVVVETALLNLHDVVVDGHEFLNSGVELLENSGNR